MTESGINLQQCIFMHKTAIYCNRWQLNICYRLTQLRKETGKTQAAFAKQFEISPRAYASYELGERDIPSSFLVKLFAELSISPTWLLTGKGSKSSDLHNENISDAVIAVRTFASLKEINFSPEKEAKLVLLLSEYFDEGGEHDGPLVKSILESSL